MNDPVATSWLSPLITPLANLALISGSSVNPMPLTQSGGTSATAIATPAIELAIRLRVRENAPAIPAAIATSRSIRFGDVRASISEPKTLTGMHAVINAAVITTTPVPMIKVTNDRRINRLLAIDIPYAMLKIGFINGATIMAPITTAVLLAMSPNVAIIVEVISKTKKPKEGNEFAMRSSSSTSIGTGFSKKIDHCPVSKSKARCKGFLLIL